MVTPPQLLRSLVACVVWVVLGLGATEAHAQPRRERRPGPAPGAPAASAEAPAKPAKDGSKAKVFDFTGLDISGRLRAPQLLYFLERANEELERASLERRSFIPEMMRSVEEEQL